MTDGEKLIKLLASKPELLKNLNISISRLCKLADYLIANGVTFATDNNVGDIMTPTDKDTNVPSKWIPVTERLPEADGRYMCNVRSFSFPGMFYQTILQYVDGGFVEGQIYTDDVTHWMPVPQPPKGE